MIIRSDKFHTLFIFSLLLLSYNFIFVYFGTNIIKYLLLFASILLLGCSVLLTGGNFYSYTKREVVLIIILIYMLLYSAFMEHNIFDITRISLHIIAVFILLSAVKISLLTKNNVTKINIEEKWLLYFLLVLLFTILVVVYNELIVNVNQGRKLAIESLNPVGVSYSLATGSIILLHLFSQCRFSINKILCLVISIASFLIILKTGSRGVLVSLLFLYILMTLVRILSSRRVKTKNLVKKTIIFIFFAILIYAMRDFIATKFSVVIERFTSILLSDSNVTKDLSILAREKIFNSYLENINSIVIYGSQYYDYYPHNQYLEFIVRFGFLGILLSIISLALFTYSITLTYSSYAKDNKLMLLICNLFVFSYIQSLSSLSLEMNKFIMLGFGMFIGNLKWRTNSSFKNKKTTTLRNYH